MYTCTCIKYNFIRFNNILSCMCCVYIRTCKLTSDRFTNADVDILYIDLCRNHKNTIERNALSLHGFCEALIAIAKKVCGETTLTSVTQVLDDCEVALGHSQLGSNSWFSAQVEFSNDILYGLWWMYGLNTSLVYWECNDCNYNMYLFILNSPYRLPHMRQFLWMKHFVLEKNVWLKLYNTLKV